MHAKHIVLVVALLFSFAAPAQVQVKSFTEKLEDSNFSFPVIEYAAHPEIADRINLYLQLTELNLVIGHQEKRIFEYAIAEGGASYEVLYNDGKILALVLRERRCGMRCTNSEVYYTFDLRSGDIVKAEDLFTVAGLSQIKTELQQQYIKNMKAQLTGSNGEQYKECLRDAEDIKMAYIYNFVPGKTSVLFRGIPCLEDDGSSQDTTSRLRRTIPQLKPMMSAFGNSFFSGGAVRKQWTEPLAGLLRGKIDGKYPITIMLQRNLDSGDNTVFGVEVYDKYGKGISLKGTFSDNKLVISEKDEFDKPTSTIDALWNGNSLVGTFKNLKTGKTMTFEASR